MERKIRPKAVAGEMMSSVTQRLRVEEIGHFEPDNIAPLLDERLPDELKELCQRIGEVGDAIGMPVYIVGGVPRDLLLGRPTFDVDIVVEGDGIVFAEQFVTQYKGRVIPHQRFKTAIVACLDGQKIDVATARMERYDYPAALPVIEPSAITHDLYRRDFTINSMAVQLNRDRYGRLIDYFGGRRDLMLGTIRVLHNLSFIEDPTRILRAIRFEQRYGFRIDSKTEHLLSSAVETRILEQVPGQRLRDELILILKEDDPLRAILRLNGFHVFRAISSPWIIDPERLTSLFKGIHRTIDWFESLYLGQSVEPWIIYLLGALDEVPVSSQRSICRRLNFHRRVVDALHTISTEGEAIEEYLATPDNLPPSRIYNILSRIPPEVVLFLMARTGEDVVRRRISLYFDRLYTVGTAVSGDDLREMGVPEGPVYREILGGVLAARLDGEVKSKDEDLTLARSLWEKALERGNIT